MTNHSHTPKTSWSEEENELLRTNYTMATLEQLALLFPTRTIHSLHSRARRLSLHRPHTFGTILCPHGVWGKKKCKDCRSVHANMLYHRHKAKIKIKVKTIWHERILNYQRKWSDEHRETIRLGAKMRKREARFKTLVAIGGNPPKCACCQESKPEFLAIDHIGGGGNKERKTMGSDMTQRIIKMIRNGESLSKYRILCHNCNMAFGFWGYCPHKPIIKTEMPPL